MRNIAVSLLNNMKDSADLSFMADEMKELISPDLRRTIKELRKEMENEMDKRQDIASVETEYESRVSELISEFYVDITNQYGGETVIKASDSEHNPIYLQVQKNGWDDYKCTVYDGNTLEQKEQGIRSVSLATGSSYSVARMVCKDMEYTSPLLILDPGEFFEEVQKKEMERAGVEKQFPIIDTALFNTVESAQELYGLAVAVKDMIPENDVFERIIDFATDVMDYKYEKSLEIGVYDESHEKMVAIDKENLTQVKNYAKELVSAISHNNPSIVLQTDNGYLEVEAEKYTNNYNCTVYNHEQIAIDKIHLEFPFNGPASSYEAAHIVCKQHNFAQVGLVTNPGTFIKQARALEQKMNEKNMKTGISAEDKLSADFDKVNFKYSIIDCNREDIFTAYADFCVDNILRGYEVADVVAVVYSKGNIESKRDSDLLYKSCVNQLMFNGSKFSKRVMYDCLSELQNLNKINMCLIKARKAIEENLGGDISVRMTPEKGYSQIDISVQISPNAESYHVTASLDEDLSPLMITKQLFNEVNGLNKQFLHIDSLGPVLNAELVHAVFVETERMSSKEKLETLQELFKEATPDFKERICNLYLGDPSAAIRQFLQEESVKIAEEKSKSVKQEVTQKREQKNIKGLDV